MSTSKNLKPITSRFSVNQSKHLGRGCFGNVYQGYDHQNNRVIAIKHLIKPQNFKDQVETLQKLSTLTHPNIMGFYGYKADKDDVYLFVEYCPGGVLTDLIKKGLDQQRVLDLFRQLVEGMCYMNAKGIMHRDLKPDNILIGANQDTKISDFGLARVQDGLQKTGQMGTPLYAGPQIYINYTDAYNFNCDVWSAGLILHEMLTKTHPFDNIKAMHELKSEWKMYERGQKRITYPKNLHPQWQYLTNIMLTFNFKKRPMFHDILQILKKLDDNGTMRKQIRDAKKGLKIEQSSSQAILQNYLTFLQQKTDILTQLSKVLTAQNYLQMKQSLQVMLIFLTVVWYIIKIKNLIRNLKFRNLKYPNKEDVVDSKNPQQKTKLILDKYRNLFQAKLTKYQNYLKQKVFPKIQQFQTKADDLNLYNSIESVYKLYEQAQQGTYDVQQTYQQQYIKLLSFHKIKPTLQKIQSMSIRQQKTYAKILLIGFINSQFPDSLYANKNVVQDKLQNIDKFNPVELRDFVIGLRNKLK